MATGHKNQSKKRKKTNPTARTDKNGVRVGYHSEAANPPELNDISANGGMNIGYHAEVANASKTEDVAGMRVGYHSERANPRSADQEDGMKIGFHSEMANPPKERDQDVEAGMNIGYHSEAANIGAHSKRLHDDKDSLTEEKTNDASDSRE